MYFTIFWVNDSEKSKGGTLWCKRAPIESKNKDQGFCEMQLLRLFYIKGSPLWYKRASIALKTWIKDFINCIYCGSFTSKGPPFGFFKIIGVPWKKSLNRFKFTKLLILAHSAASQVTLYEFAKDNFKDTSPDLYALLDMAKIRISYKQNTTNIIMVSSSNVPQMALIAFRNLH